MTAPSNTATIETLRKAVDFAFNKYDKDHNGTIEYDEYVTMTNEIFKYHAYGPAEKEIKEVFDQADRINKDGRITKEEFILYLKQMYKVK